MLPACPNCHSSEAKRRFAPMPGQPTELIQCAGCRHTWSVNVVAEAEQTRFYRDDYAANQIVFRKSALLAEDYWKKIGCYLDKKTRILEIGGSFGHFSQLLHRNGFDVVLNELNLQAVDYARSQFQFHVLAAGFETIDQNESFDAIFAGHVIEHLADPSLLFQHARRLLRPGGKLILLTPNADSWKFRLFGPGWCWASPDHLSFLSQQSAEDFLRKNDFDSELIAGSAAHPCHYPGVLVGWVSRLKNILKGKLRRSQISGGAETIATTGDHGIVARIFRLLNFLATWEARLWAWIDRRPFAGDELIIVARKKN